MNETLIEMLTYCRPMGGRTERKFRNRYLRPLGAIADPWGNLHVRVGTAPTILWSCHTDTVHRDGGRQDVTVSPLGKFVWLPYGTSSRCLGGDDTVGVYLMAEMIRAGVAGDYVFHYGEEHGGLGSTLLARHRPEWLAEHQYAVALDRQGTGDIITYQSHGRCASDAFADSMAEVLAALDPALDYGAEYGVYTDTAEYADIIPECTNLSIGYNGQHTSLEEVDLEHVERLRAALCQFDASGLICARDPDESDDWRYSGDQWDTRADLYDYALDAKGLHRETIDADTGELVDPYDWDTDDDPATAQRVMRRLFDVWQAEERSARKVAAKDPVRALQLTRAERVN